MNIFYSFSAYFQYLPSFFKQISLSGLRPALPNYPLLKNKKGHPRGCPLAVDSHVTDQMKQASAARMEQFIKAVNA